MLPDPAVCRKRGMKRRFLASCRSGPRESRNAVGLWSGGLYTGELTEEWGGELSDQGPAEAGPDSPVATGPRGRRAQGGAVQSCPQRREGDFGVKKADSVSSKEGRAPPCPTGPQGTGKVGTVARVWVKTETSSRVPSGARPGPEAAVPRPRLRTRVVPPRRAVCKSGGTFHCGEMHKRSTPS